MAEYPIPKEKMITNTQNILQDFLGESRKKRPIDEVSLKDIKRMAGGLAQYVSNRGFHKGKSVKNIKKEFKGYVESLIETSVDVEDAKARISAWLGQP